jgi:G3E family GTPase
MSADYIMVGGFLGAGKTTAMLRLAEYLTARNRRVGLITNDQSQGLVDTSLVTNRGYPVEEITGGCFCCRFDSLTEAANRLARAAQPDVFLAEPVGSCTDLRATVQYPLSRMYGSAYRIAPLSVLVDPIRALNILGITPGRSFSPKVLYVYTKQLEEADLLLINKSDVIDESQRQQLEAALRERFPQAEVLTVSARTGAGLDAWFQKLESSSQAETPAMEVDYDVYADGEALLGWLNATVELAAQTPFDGNALLQQLADGIRHALSTEACEIAHLKMTLTPDHGTDIGAINLVRSGGRAELSHRLAESVDAGELIVNLRAECDPERLHVTVNTVLRLVSTDLGIAATISHGEHFRPGRPQPTHRLANVSE